MAKDVATMTNAMRITQCLQNDFVKSRSPGEPLPNRLHIGRAEAGRLPGERLKEGPVARAMAWAHARSPRELFVIHVRDWHDADDLTQRSHLERFGPHGVAGTDGARFVTTPC